MNADRRKQLDKAYALLEQAKEIVETAQSEEQDCYNNLSEGLQQTERGQQYETNAFYLQDAMDNLDSAMEKVEEAKQ